MGCHSKYYSNQLSAILKETQIDLVIPPYYLDHKTNLIRTKKSIISLSRPYIDSFIPEVSIIFSSENKINANSLLAWTKLLHPHCQCISRPGLSSFLDYNNLEQVIYHPCPHREMVLFDSLSGIKWQSKQILVDLNPKYMISLLLDDRLSILDARLNIHSKAYEYYFNYTRIKVKED